MVAWDVLGQSGRFQLGSGAGGGSQHPQHVLLQQLQGTLLWRQLIPPPSPTLSTRLQRGGSFTTGRKYLSGLDGTEPGLVALQMITRASATKITKHFLNPGMHGT